MTMTAMGARIAVKNILYLTDFSEQSEAALPFALALARNYGAKVHALHVLTPVIPEGCPAAVEADEMMAADAMKTVDARLTSVDHVTEVIEGMELWPAVERAVKEEKIDLIVLGTHGRTRARKLLLGSVAEEIFRRSSVPVLTIGPEVAKVSEGKGAFHSVLFATDFSKPCEAAAPFAISFAEESDARLVLLYVEEKEQTNEQSQRAMVDIVGALRAIVPAEARLWCRPAAVVQYGEIADRVLETASERDSDLIVMGVRNAGAHLGAATHLDTATAHKVVVHANCPVLTVRA